VATYACYDREGIYAVGNTPEEAWGKCRRHPSERDRLIAKLTERAAERLTQLFAEKQVFFAWDGTLIGRGLEGELLDVTESFELELAGWYWRKPMGLHWSQLPKVEEVVLSENFVIRRSERRRRRGK
jgi:hypothetical protein